MTLRDEIIEQPEVAARFLRRAPEVVGPFAETLRDRGVDHVVIAARGTSDHAAIYAQYVLGVRHALSVDEEKKKSWTVVSMKNDWNESSSSKSENISRYVC